MNVESRSVEVDLPDRYLRYGKLHGTVDTGHREWRRVSRSMVLAEWRLRSASGRWCP